jgi:hypothetical protein
MLAPTATPTTGKGRSVVVSTIAAPAAVVIESTTLDADIVDTVVGVASDCTVVAAVESTVALVVATRPVVGCTVEPLTVVVVTAIAIVDDKLDAAEVVVIGAL